MKLYTIDIADHNNSNTVIFLMLTFKIAELRHWVRKEKVNANNLFDYLFQEEEIILLRLLYGNDIVTYEIEIPESEIEQMVSIIGN